MARKIWLVMKTAGRERRFPLHKHTTIIGRDIDSDLRVALPSVANRHCELKLDGGELRLIDLGSTHGTLHNGNSVREATLEADDRVTVGTVTFRVQMDEPPVPAQASPN
jgi:pSer/pThr/pTyr-binding forkhead associated (FHA) protein